MFIEHNPHSFLTGDSPFLLMVPVDASKGRFEAEIVFELHHEGVIGLPHGGVAMGLCLDAWRRFGHPLYPVDVSFKFGGSGISLGEKVSFAVERDPADNGMNLVARITKTGDKRPYLRAEIRPAGIIAEKRLVLPPPAGEPRKLPYYRNCFVCGHHRAVVGLQRRFRIHAYNGSTVITTPWGPDTDDVDRAQLFLIGKRELHPAVLISIFDENTGWAGFMATKGAGLTVRMEFTLLRPVADSEKLLFVSRPAGIKGNPRAPRFFIAEGTVLSMIDPGNPEPVAYGRGEWIIMDQYTEQIKKNLLPVDDWEWIFWDNQG
jgi:acyl-coenzyme A thioesterase PaaI-like protein